MTKMLLTRSQHRPMSHLSLGGDITLARGRLHEICGPSRRSLALIWAQACAGEGVVWVEPAWAGDMLHPAGVQPWIEPGRVIWTRPRRGQDVLWCLEEALRAGVGGMVVGDLPELPGLTAVRRLHLAAEAGARAGQASLAVLLGPGDGGAPGVETRWHMAPTYTAEHAHSAVGEHMQAWRLERRRARMAPPAAWQLKASDDEGRRVNFLPEVVHADVMG